MDEKELQRQRELLRERYKRQYGYTDTMLDMDDLIEESAEEEWMVRVIDKDGTEYVGKVDWYSKADDEENGFCTFVIDQWGLSVDVIKSIEILDGPKKGDKCGEIE